MKLSDKARAMGMDESRIRRALPAEEFAVAVKVDRAIRPHGESLHRSGKPLESVDLTPSTQVDAFGNECWRMCGV